MSNDNDEHSASDYVGLGNTILTAIIILLLMGCIIVGIPAGLNTGLQIDRLSDQIDNGQRQYVYATPTPVMTEHMSRGEIMRERAKRGREAQHPPFWTGR